MVDSGTVRRGAGKLVWFEPVEPLGGIGRIRMTTRVGGASFDPYDSFNLGLHVNDVGERVRMNRISLVKSLPKGLLEPVVGDQVHGTHIEQVGGLHAGARWHGNEAALEGTDALVTATRYLPLVSLVADCLPVALVDPERGVGAVAHAGWRGLAGGVLESTLGAMRSTWGTTPSDVVAWLGPCIGACCFEVGPEVAEHFRPFAAPGSCDRFQLDLRAAAKERLGSAGLIEENIDGLNLCTSCEDALFFSHRRATTREGKKTTGRQALILWLEPAHEGLTEV